VPAQLASQHGERPAAEAQVVDEQARAVRERVVDREGAAHVGNLLGRVSHLALRRAFRGSPHGVGVGEVEGAGEPLREVGHEGAAAIRWDGAHPRRVRPPAHDLGGRLDELVVEPARAPPRLHGRVPPAVTEAGERAALLGAHVVGQLAHRAVLVGRHLLDLEHERLGAQVQGGGPR